jgi:phosphonopyruvate decarboxylase
MSGRIEGTGFISATGFISRACHKVAKHLDISRLFRMVGGMGHGASVAQGMVLTGNQKARLSVIEGDGGALMHLGQFAGLSSTVGVDVFILDNGTHESVGGNPRVGQNVNWLELARAFGFEDVSIETTSRGLQNRCRTLDELGLTYCSTFTIVPILRDNENSSLPRPENLRALAFDFHQRASS